MSKKDEALAEQPATVQQGGLEMVDDEGENQAVRMFLALYGGACGVTSEQMRKHLKMAGFDGAWPEWANSNNGHLTKAGAQLWIRHLFALAEQPAQQNVVAWESDRGEIYYDKEDAFRYSDGFIRLLVYGDTPQAQPAQQQEPVRVPVADNTYNYAKSLAEAIFKQHFASDEHYSSGRIVWGVNDTVIGILTQIDNMVADMVRRPAQQEPVAMWDGKYQIEFGDLSAYKHGEHSWTPLYTSPPAQRTWVGLTDDEILYCVELENPKAIAEEVEAKLRERNT